MLRRKHRTLKPFTVPYVLVVVCGEFSDWHSFATYIILMIRVGLYVTLSLTVFCVVQVTLLPVTPLSEWRQPAARETNTMILHVTKCSHHSTAHSHQSIAYSHQSTAYIHKSPAYSHQETAYSHQSTFNSHWSIVVSPVLGTCCDQS